jgi:hypothetical protein
MDLQAARQIWERRGIDDYIMVVRLSGAWFGGAALVKVRDGAPVLVRPLGDEAGSPPEAFGEYDTVEELFGIVERAMQNEAHHLDARYDTRLGLPVEVFVDRRTTVADDEHGFVVESFVPR